VSARVFFALLFLAIAMDAAFGARRLYFDICGGDIPCAENIGFAMALATVAALALALRLAAPGHYRSLQPRRRFFERKP
jgi:hypothetical protein